MKKLVVMQVRSVAGCPEIQRQNISALGLRGLHSTVVVNDTPSFRGMIRKVIHLVKVEVK